MGKRSDSEGRKPIPIQTWSIDDQHGKIGIIIQLVLIIIAIIVAA